MKNIYIIKPKLLVALSITFGLCITDAFSSPTDASSSPFTWGKGFQPPQLHAAAFTKKVYKKSELTSLPILKSDEKIEEKWDYLDQLNVFSIQPPHAAITPQNIYYGTDTVRFTTEIKSVFAETYNSAASGKEEEDKDITPINIEDGNYMGHGILFSLFRSMDEDKEHRSKGQIVVGTACLASPSCLVTAAHNVVLSDFNRKYSALKDYNLRPYAERVEFWPLLNGFPKSTAYETTGALKDNGVRVKGVKIHPKWDAQGPQSNNYDIAVLKLSKNIGEIYGYPAAKLFDPKYGNPPTNNVTVSGYPIEEDKMLFIIKTCPGEITDTTFHKVFYNVAPDTRRGQSGSAIILPNTDPSEPPIFIGSHTTGRGTGQNAGGVLFNEEKFSLVGKWVTDFENE